LLLKVICYRPHEILFALKMELAAVMFTCKRRSRTSLFARTRASMRS